MRQGKWPPDVGGGRARPARFRLVDHGDARHDLTGCTKAALESVVLDERRLDRVELAVPLQPFDGGDPLALLHRRERHAGEDAASLDMHGTGPALAAIAPLFCAGQRQFFTQRVEQRHARLDQHPADLTVDRQAHRHALDASFSRSPGLEIGRFHDGGAARCSGCGAVEPASVGLAHRPIPFHWAADPVVPPTVGGSEP
jgi:hypothetical protein